MITYKTKDGDELDLICYEVYGFTHGAVEAVLDINTNLKNGMSLADFGPTLPAGLEIKLPDLPRPTETEELTRLSN